MTQRRLISTGDRVFIQDGTHPWSGHAGITLAYERYGLGWTGWRIRLDGNCGECYANASQLASVSARAIRDAKKITARIEGADETD